MRIFHTADWHLGKLINNVFMTEDQNYILDQFKLKIDKLKPEVIIIAGDIYDRSIPPVEAVNLLDSFLEDIVLKRGIKVILSSGNHDSSDRLNFGSNLLKSKGLYIVSKSDRAYEKITLEDEYGALDFYVLPYGSPFDLRQIYKDSGVKSADEAMRFIVDQIRSDDQNDLTASRRRVLVAHGFVVGTEEPETSESERPLTIGGTDYISYAHFESFDYVALGHLHNPQRVGRETVRYSGSLLKYSFSEKNRQKGFVVIDMGDKAVNAEYTPVVTFEALMPLRDMRVIKGELSMLVTKEIVSAGNPLDYLHVILTDQGDLLDPINTLRSVYPNVLSLQKEVRMRSTVDTHQELIRKEKDPLNLFSYFFEQIEGRSLKPIEESCVVSAIEKATKDGEL